jgi:hypothetical protein
MISFGELQPSGSQSMRSVVSPARILEGPEYFGERPLVTTIFIRR